MEFYVPFVRRHRRAFGIRPGIYFRTHSSVVGKFHRADPVTVDVEQRFRIVVVTANQFALGLEVHAIDHDLEDAGQFAFAVVAVEQSKPVFLFPDDLEPGTFDTGHRTKQESVSRVF